MSDYNGKTIVDMITEGVSTHVKDHVRDAVIDEMVEDFREKITHKVDDILSEMVFNAYSNKSPVTMSEELKLLIEWSKGTAQYKTKYTLQSEVVEG